MFAKPTERAWWRKLTLSEWVSALSAIGTLLSAVFALLAVLAAKEQVRAAFGVVNRAEMIKSLSEYSQSLHAICLASIPPDLAAGLRVFGIAFNNGGLHLVPTIEYEIKVPNIPNNDLVAIIVKHDPPVEKMIRKSVETAKGLAPWLETGRAGLDLFAQPISMRNYFSKRTELDLGEAIKKMSARYTACENGVDAHIAGFLK